MEKQGARAKEPVEKQGSRSGVPAAVEKQEQESSGPRRLAVVVTDEEMAIFRSLADAEGLTVSGWIRLTARQAYKRLLTKKAKAAVKRRTR